MNRNTPPSQRIDIEDIYFQTSRGFADGTRGDIRRAPREIFSQ